jgi:hypothetical protein
VGSVGRGGMKSAAEPVYETAARTI